MALEHRLELKMLQKLILTPQLQQAIRLLQLPQIELSQTIEKELMENPFLEEVAEDSGSPGSATGASDGMSEPGSVGTSEVDPQGEASDYQEDSYQDTLSYAEADGVGVEKMSEFSTVDDYFEDRSYSGRDLGYFGGTDDAGMVSLDQYAEQDGDLVGHLQWQLRFTDASPDVRAAAEAVIGNIDENGYLQATIEDIARGAGGSIEDAVRGLALVREFDPPGVGATTLPECLLLQLRHLGLGETLVESLVRDNLHDIEKRRYQQLAQTYGCGLAEIKEAVKVIEGLDPKPGSSFSSAPSIYIKPDVFVVRDGEEFRILLNDESMPSIRINSYYRQILMARKDLDDTEREYLDERHKAALWLLKSLDHRNKTIYRVTECIVNFQREFFMEGVEKLRPMNLKAVAMELEMHESTISRATANKYLSCAHGLFGFRYFFSGAVSSSSGSVSSTSVKDLIRRIVLEENKKKPLSDQKIVDMLESQQIKVARRTVAKYRDELGIAPQSQRRVLD